MIVSMTAADLVKWIAWGPVRVRRIQGWNNNAAAVYIQFHQTPPLTYVGSVATLTAGQVPAVKSFVAPASNGFDYEWINGLELNELTIGLSSSEVNFTSVLANAGLDMTVWIDTLYAVDAFTNLKGDLTTGLDSTVVAADTIANAGWRLLRVDYINNDPVVRWLQFVADISGLTGPIFQTQAAVSGDANNLDHVSWFCAPGMHGFSIDKAGTKHYGIVLIQSSVGTAVQVTATAVSVFRAIYSTRSY